MEHYYSLETVDLRRAWLTIGAYDGVHIGHQAIIRQLTADAHKNGAPAVVLTFHPHPARVIRNRQGPLYLTTPERRAELLSELGVDVIITYPFDQQTAQSSGAEFLKLIDEYINIEALWVGYDFAMGHKRDTDVAALKILGEQMGFDLYVFPPVQQQEEVVSSSLIRSLLGEGRVEDATRFLGRPYEISGKVVPGDGRGRTIGIPTANLDFWEEQILPSNGVYACRAEVGGQTFDAAVNVGVRPTFDSNSTRAHVEAHLLDANLDLYGQSIRLEFMHYLRGEIKFGDIQSLLDQIHKDISQTRRLLAT